MRIGKAAAVVVIATLGAGAVSGCSTIEDKTGLGTKAQIGAAGGAAGGLIIAAVSGASAAWVVGSAVLGAVAGGVVGDFLDRRDTEQMAQSGHDALENEGPGGQTAWRNPLSGNSGSTTIDAAFVNAEGFECKKFTQTFTSDGETHDVTGTACRQSDRTWTVATG